MKNNNINNKKADVTFIFITVLISLLSFFIIFNFFVNSSENVVSNTDDLICKTLVTGKEISKLTLPVFLYEIENKCKIDTSLKINLDKKEETFQTLANSLERCFFRYGDGKVDFMSNFDTTGNWCFTCSKIEIEKSIENIDYNEFIEWTKSNPKNLKENEKTYYQKINLIYSKKDNNLTSELKEEYDSILRDIEKDASLKNILFVLSDELNRLDDLSNKKLDSSDKNLFIVFRYNRLEKDFNKKMSDATDTALIGAVGGIAATILTEMAIESITFGAVGGISTGGILAVPSAVVGAVFGGIKGSINIVTKGIDATTKLLRIKNLISKVKSLTKFSAKTTELSTEFIKINSKKDIEELILKLGEKDEAKKLKELNTILGKSKANNLEELSKLVEIKRDTIDDIKKLLPLNPSTGQLKNLKKHENSYNKYLELDKNFKDVLNKLEKGENIPIESQNLLREYIVLSPAIIGAMGGLILGYDVINSDYQQYVDVMNYEQYYRLCGLEPTN